MKNNFPEDPVARSRRRAIQYQHVDGGYEFTFGGAILLMAVCFAIVGQLISANSFFSNTLLPFAPLVVFVGGGYLIDFLVQRFRMRVTYPRTGYLTYQKPQPLKRSTRWAIRIGIPLLTVVLLGITFLNRARFPTGNQDFASALMPSFFGLLFSGLWVVIGWKVSVPRFYLTAAVTLLVSAGLFLNGVGGNTAWAGL
ncbi:MAG: hypothetical protein PHQ40_15330, partial [Anaerolineaceae bacterium]|nr:hypothetical protein [Anaerolineaceae bacterium]